MKQLSTLFIAIFSILVLTACTANRFDTPTDVMEKDSEPTSGDAIEQPSELEGYPIDVPADQEEVKYQDGMDPAFEALKELEG